MRISRPATLAVALIASAFVIPTALAQEGREGGGPPPGARPSPDQFVDRMMENDANGDGKLSKDEIPGRFAEQMFAAGDTDKDGFLTREELVAYFNSRAQGFGRPQGGPGGPGGDAGAPATLHAYMNQAGQALRALRRSGFGADAQADDLVHITVIEAALAGAKSKIDPDDMAPQAKEKYGDDKAAYMRDMRLSINKSIRAALDLEEAILSGNAAASKAALEKLLAVQKEGHAQFQPKEEEAPAGRGPRGGGRGNRGGGGADGDDDGGN